MKTSLATVFKRREKILEQLKGKGVVYVDELAQEFHVSPLTIRRDLELFEKKQMIERSYGKATYIQGTIHRIDDPVLLLSSDDAIIEQKVKIAEHAAGLVSDGMRLFVNSGVTALFFILANLDKNVTIFTNNLLINEHDLAGAATVFLTGGEIYNHKSLVGEVAIQTLTMQTADMCFLGTDAIDERLITSHSLLETLINRTMIEYTNGKKVILAEGSKIGQQTNFMTTHTKLVTDLITDSSVDSNACGLIRAQDVEVSIL
ncbi:DeoR/GlpR family DNA-binding transcription regulator [Culicoidibacter larvae]|uniref:DeoR/GlpR transcriptional regulator n=1 Tax=Culicoidibacter larvae TaxID=2579976 RepID=A0A5R8QIG5_9FIRM|nr:DeoR/GlpR family DNA-binding transcription regulator [Culicoidibacter larvae]TLG77233.1 DeoR/GlpR transcriptional regulator [Culicoidibacter larvae]